MMTAPAPRSQAGKSDRNTPPRDGLATLRPVYELRMSAGRDGPELSIWQLPSAATPRLTGPECAATLKGRVLELVEARVRKRLKAAGVKVPDLKPGQQRKAPIDEELALGLGLLFRVLAPMRSIERIRQVTEQIEQMNREEAGYWLGMTLHRKNPRRVLFALRVLLTTAPPSRK